ncbi:MAG: hypothetical protein A2X70_01950 [Alphaproteobacteria bacterium GWC2_42_16]|nr:MAG: hypothetical protein A2X70_01950 [Alphaproteobacteria bacterium GWC2_42_16]OFW74260.1 MAG: hypothetical protein A2Z80_05975 [Alphaproteobacteria bacterium GWA2_41_27]OFW84485.1 MAG: hypothetical protein A3E50_07615 [Alphaproteobacteria bacterium RIFCSPHIGHO2_12_FULL_42_100]OFW86704.1 MAG: hypothetical protein A2W06_07715 [Alphaproteobacteria bacterium RBG_16_42_14]OFW92331.1 MAG: hypothetical protein A3C41_01700 [Alphaproteobacteria bacterium RIFCSPHIGHO2_02_FULL_42_30]OFW93734.1 MAG: 
MVIVGGLLSATLSFSHVVFHPGLVFVSYLGTLPLFLIGLGVGPYPLYGAAIFASSLVFMVEGLFSGGEFLILSALGPIFLVNRVLLHKTKANKTYWYPASYLLRDLTLASTLVMALSLGFYFYFTFGETPSSFIAKFLKAFDPEGTMKGAEPVLLTLFPFLPGFLAFSWSLMMLINGALAQGLLVRFHRNLRTSPSLQDLLAPKYLSFFLGLSFFLAFFGVEILGVIGKNFTVIFLFSFFLVGLGQSHVWIHKTSFPIFVLTLFYFCLMVLIWPVFIVCLIGILKPWLDKTFPTK